MLMASAATAPTRRQLLNAGWHGLRDGRAGCPVVGRPGDDPDAPEQLLGPGDGQPVSTGYVDALIAEAEAAQAELARDLHSRTVPLQAQILPAAQQVVLAHEKAAAIVLNGAKAPVPDGRWVSQADVALAREHRTLERDQERLHGEFRAAGDLLLGLVAQWSAQFNNGHAAAEAAVQRARQLIGHYRDRVMRYHRQRAVVANWQPPAPQLSPLWSCTPLTGLAVMADAEAAAIVTVALRLLDPAS